MSRLIGLLAFTAAAVIAIDASAEPLVVQADNFETFSGHFCSAGHDSEHIFILPAAVFSENSKIECDGGVYGLRMSEPADDPGHTVFNIDPPHDSKTALDCDGKADTGMEIISVNCIPADMENAAHKKS